MAAVEKLADNVDSTLREVKLALAPHLKDVHRLQPPPGLASGISVFDDFLLWKGIPKGDMSLFNGRPGTGATSLWISTASKVHEENKWVAWINSDWELFPTHLAHKKVNLKRLLVVKKPSEEKKLFWVLQEMITSSLFEMIGCHCTSFSFKTHQLQKLKKLARMHQVALVLVSALQSPASYPLFALVIECQRDFFTVRRALHRPTPFTVAGSLIYEDLMPQLTKNPRTFLC